MYADLNCEAGSCVLSGDSKIKVLSFYIIMSILGSVEYNGRSC